MNSETVCVHAMWRKRQPKCINHAFCGPEETYYILADGMIRVTVKW